MATRRSEFDVTDSVNTTDPSAVEQEVMRIYQNLYSAQIRSSDHARIRAIVCGSIAAQTRATTRATPAYHNLQHVFEVTLAMARLMDGYERSRRFSEPLGAGAVRARHHHCAVPRHRLSAASQGHTPSQRRGIHAAAREPRRYFLEEYMQEIGCREWARVAGRIIHFTGYEMPVQRIDVPSRRLSSARQHARQRGYHRADVRSLLSGKMSRPAVSGIRLGRARLRAGVCATQGDRVVQLAAGPAAQDAGLLSHRDRAAGRSSGRGVPLCRRRTSAATTCIWMSSRRTSAMPNGSPTRAIWRACGAFPRPSTAFRHRRPRSSAASRRHAARAARFGQSAAGQAVARIDSRGRLPRLPTSSMILPMCASDSIRACAADA